MSAGKVLVVDDEPEVRLVLSEFLESRGFEVAAAESGQALFRATARLRLPPALSESSLRAALEAVAADLMVDVELASDN